MLVAHLYTGYIRSAADLKAGIGTYSQKVG